MRARTEASWDAGGGRRAALPCSCTPRFLVSGPFLTCGPVSSCQGPGTDASRAQIPAPAARHPGPDLRPAPLRRACASLYGVSPPEREPVRGAAASARNIPYPAVIPSGRLRS
ncbi:hypothetical protein GCM10010398_47260 [Streptomyces fimbriatus]